MPHVEVDRPDRERDEGVREDPERMDETEDRPEDRPVQTGEHRERRQVAEQDVLEHVEAEELLLAEDVDRRDEREEDEGEAEPEHPGAPALDGRAAPPQSPHPPRVEQGDDEGRHELQRLQRPARQDRGRGVHLA